MDSKACTALTCILVKKIMKFYSVFRDIYRLFNLHFRDLYEKKTGTSYILYTKNVMEKDGILHLPIYMTMFL